MQGMIAALSCGLPDLQSPYLQQVIACGGRLRTGA